MNYVYIATSIDGYIATKSGDTEWLHELPNPNNSDYGYSEFIANIDALIMGRNSFEKVRTFETWPYDKKVFVLTNTLTEIPKDLIGKVEFISGKLDHILSSVHSQGFHNLYIDGGLVIQQFLEHDMIDELIITRIPILLGSGIPLFGELSKPLRFIHKETTVYDGAIVKSHLTRNKTNA
jgi:dihydrofolate reductase